MTAEAMVRLRLETTNSWSVISDELYNAQVWTWPVFEGKLVQKLTIDLWRYIEVIEATRPDTIIETGTASGGSAAFYAGVQRMFGIAPHVITIDSQERRLPPMHGVAYVCGDSGSPEIHEQVVPFIDGATMVVLDSDHSARHVRRELNLWADCVTQGCYLVVEDTNLNGHPSAPDFGWGPMEALAEWLPAHSEFTVDGEIEEHHGPTFYPGGWLVRQ